MSKAGSINLQAKTPSSIPTKCLQVFEDEAPAVTEALVPEAETTLSSLQAPTPKPAAAVEEVQQLGSAVAKKQRKDAKQAAAAKKVQDLDLMEAEKQRKGADGKREGDPRK